MGPVMSNEAELPDLPVVHVGPLTKLPSLLPLLSYAVVPADSSNFRWMTSPDKAGCVVDVVVVVVVLVVVVVVVILVVVVRVVVAPEVVVAEIEVVVAPGSVVVLDWIVDVVIAPGIVVVTLI
jgi:hypothetical protein